MIVKKRFSWEILSLTRFFLAFIVMSGHSVSLISNPGLLKWISLFGSFQAILGFLLISGLSIGNSLLKSPEHYFKRRVQRIYPVYLASMVLAFIVSPSAITGSYVLAVLINILFLNQMITNTSLVGPAWSLSLEAWLYILAPFFMRLPYKILLIIIYISFGSYCFYTAGRSLYHWPYYSGTAYGVNLLFLSFIWIAGFLLAKAEDKKEDLHRHIAFLFTTHFCLTTLIQILFRIKNHAVGLLLSTDLPELIGHAACLFLVYYVIIFNASIPKTSTNIKKLFNFLGNISYPLYLTHLTLLKLCERLQIGNWILTTFICLTGASLVYWIFDFYSKKREAKEVVTVNIQDKAYHQ